LRTLLLLAWPVVVARASQTVIGFTDAAMVGHLGEDALAAATTGAMNTFTIAILPMGICFVVQSFAAQLTGRGDAVAARRFAWYGLGLAAATAVVSLVVIPLVGPILGLLEYSSEVRRLQTEYLQLRLLGMGGMIGIEALGAWFGGRGDTRPHMHAGFLAMAANLVFNWIFIYGNLGAPALGVAGSAIASTIAEWLAFGYIAWRFAREPAGKAPRLGLRAAEFLRLLRFGLPSGVNFFLEFGAFAVFLNVVVARLGTTILAALNVVIQLNSVSFMPGFGIASAGAILAGQAVGRGDKDGVWPILRLTGGVALTWQLAVGAFYLAAPAVAMGWFAPDGDEGRLVAVGAAMLAISAAWQLFDAGAITIGEILRAAGDTTWCMWARIALAWLVWLPAAGIVVFALDGGHIGAMIVLVGYIVLLAIVLALRFRSGRWRAIDLTGMEAAMLDEGGAPAL
jgi:MATE family multidrug resistance protein